MAKKNNDFFDDFFEKGQKSAKKTAKKKVKKLHGATKVLAVLFLLIGIGVGALACMMMGKNDRFLLSGSKQITLPAGESYTYVEEGFEAVAFGLDCSDKVQVKKDDRITVDASGNYVIPAQEGVYTITYTVNAYKFQKGENGVIKRIRTFTVNAAEEDGRNG
jgi:hypothetical protein